MELFEAIEGRRTVRAFDAEPVDRDILERIIGAAGQAPSPANSQPWHFHVATGAARARVGQVMALSTVHLQEYMDLLAPDDIALVENFFADLGRAPVAIALTVPAETDDVRRINTYTSCGCALENLLLAAYGEGLGCCNLTFPFWVRDQLFEALGIASDREIVSLVVIGHPAESPERPQRRDDIATYLD